MSEALLYEKKDHIAYITINRPEAYNCMNRDVWEGIISAWESVRDDKDVWVAIVTGAGEKAFCAGQDLKEMAQWMAIPEAERPPFPIPEPNPMKGLFIPKPFIAAINGVCTGGGLEFAMACDLRIASDNARLGLAEVKQGLMAGNSGTQKLIRLAPFAPALEMLMTGDFISAQEAHRICLINKVVPQADLMKEAEALAARICEAAPLSVQGVKECAYRGIEVPLEEGLKIEAEVMDRVGQSEDAKEGPRAFGEKRKPQWQMK
ncbi:MAG: enoyl-CoA hydratase-related protein [Dehalococcoidia bacterium]